MTNRIQLTSEWQQVTDSSSTVLVQSGAVASIYLGSTAPAAEAPGFNIKWGVPIEINVAAYGGGCWAKGRGTLTYVNAV